MINNSKIDTINVPDYLEDFFSTLSIKKETFEIYARYINKFLDFHNNDFCLDIDNWDTYEIDSLVDFEQIDTSEVIMFLSDLNLKYNPTKVALTSLKALFSYLVDGHIISNNPCLSNDIKDFMDNKRNSEEKQLLEIEEINSIFHFINVSSLHKKSIYYRDLCIMSCFLILGLKTSEVINLDYYNVDLENSILHVGKRCVSFGTTFKFYLEKYIESQDIYYHFYGKNVPLFISEQGNRMGNQTIVDIVKKYTKCINKKVSSETLRQTAINRVYSITNDFLYVADYFGYDNLNNLRQVLNIIDKPNTNAINEMDKIISNRSELI